MGGASGHRRGWWTVGDPPRKGNAKRWTLFSVKGGVGRGATAAVLARHLARGSERVLVVDLDLESPALSSAMLEPGARPDFGVADWFVEDLVGQGDRVIESMTAAPAWADDVKGAAAVAPALGRDSGEYLAKLGRVHMESAKDPWAARLERLLTALEARLEPTVVLLDSRCGLHDIAAAAVTDIAARVLLFADGSEAGWADYGFLFRHWRQCRLATSMRQLLSFVSALTPRKTRLHIWAGSAKEHGDCSASACPKRRIPLRNRTAFFVQRAGGRRLPRPDAHILARGSRRRGVVARPGRNHGGDGLPGLFRPFRLAGWRPRKRAIRKRLTGANPRTRP